MIPQTFDVNFPAGDEEGLQSAIGDWQSKIQPVFEGVANQPTTVAIERTPTYIK